MVGTELNQLDWIYNNMLTSAETNVHNRPYIRSFNNRKDPISVLVIPTLEDLKLTMFEPGDLGPEVGYPLKVTTKEDIESASFSGLVSSWNPWSLQHDTHYSLKNN